MSLLEVDGYTLNDAAEKLGVSRGNLNDLIRRGVIKSAVYIDSGGGVSFDGMSPLSALLFLCCEEYGATEASFKGDGLVINSNTSGVHGHFKICLPFDMEKDVLEKESSIAGESDYSRSEMMRYHLRSYKEYFPPREVGLCGYYSIDKRVASEFLDDDKGLRLERSQVPVLGGDGLPFYMPDDFFNIKIGRGICLELLGNTIFQRVAHGSIVSRLYVTKEEINRIESLDGQEEGKGKSEIVDPRERTNFLRIIKALALENEIDMNAHFAAAEVIMAMGAKHGIDMPDKPDTVAKKIREALYI